MILQECYVAAQRAIDTWGYDRTAFVKSCSIGVLIFPLSLGVVQHIFRILHVTNGSVFAPVIGCAAVGISGCIAAVAVIEGSDFLRDTSHVWPYWQATSSSLPKPSHPDTLKVLAIYSIGTIIVFKVFGGCFSSVLPSCVKYPGAFAKDGLHGSHRYAHKSQREKIVTMGRKHGCHSCGRRWFQKSFIADHQPPLSLVQNNRGKKYFFNMFQCRQPQQKLYPQCRHCSLQQQKYLQSPDRFSPIVTHVTSMRLYHLFLPLPYMWAFIQDVASSL